MRAAPSGETVTVRGGTYLESIRISKPLTLTAPQGATLDGSSRNSGADGIRLYNDANVTVSGFTVEGWDHGIDAYNVDTPFVVEDVVLRQNRDGLYVDDTYNGWTSSTARFTTTPTPASAASPHNSVTPPRTTGVSPTVRPAGSAAATWTAATSCRRPPTPSRFRPIAPGRTSWRTTARSPTPRFRTRFEPRPLARPSRSGPARIRSRSD
nr:hypothetical protein [Halorussus sp. MSC15.2]